jgi:hypothetical protein
MSDPLLSSLCRICNIQVPKYTCPRCSLQTCSLACSKRHKVWSSCNGERDPTVYKPPSQLATPAGIDHDYNFLHGIEHRIERSEKTIVDDRGLVGREELERARNGEGRRKGKRNEAPGAVLIDKALMNMGIVVHRAPTGMQRNRENATNWSRGSKCIHWQVEWILAEGQRRVLSKALGKSPIGEVYLALLEDQRKSKMTEEEKRAEKKRKAAELKQRTMKKARIDRTNQDPSSIAVLQDPETGAWSFASASIIPDTTHEEPPEPTPSLSEHLYLLRPRTPSSFPKVLVPLDPSKPLDHHLKRRQVLEFPTIYALANRPEDLPEQFMLEDAYTAATGHRPMGVDMEGERPLIEEMSTSGDGETSSSDSGDDSGEDEEMEDGEIV